MNATVAGAAGLAVFVEMAVFWGLNLAIRCGLITLILPLRRVQVEWMSQQKGTTQ